jgi:hypothetical protein
MREFVEEIVSPATNEGFARIVKGIKLTYLLVFYSISQGIQYVRRSNQDQNN